MAKYKVGDKVRVITNGERNKRYYMEDRREHNTMVPKMLEFCGKVVTIKDVDAQYHIEECGYGWVDEMFEGLAEETPREFKVGDRVKVNENGLCGWEVLREYDVDLGTVVVYNNKDSIGIEFDKHFGGHNCGVKNCKDGHGWWLTDREIELVKEEPKAEPTPTPVVNVNVTVNLYENACWYCRKGGLVDLYLAGAMGICPSCGRVCNNTFPTKPKKESIVIEFKPSKPKENKPLTNDEYQALPVGTKVYVVWRWDLEKNCKTTPKWDISGWGVKKGDKCEWKKSNGGITTQSNCDYDRCFDAYLEEPERPEPTLPF